MSPHVLSNVEETIQFPSSNPAIFGLLELCALGLWLQVGERQVCVLNNEETTSEKDMRV